MPRTGRFPFPAAGLVLAAVLLWPPLAAADATRGLRSVAVPQVEDAEFLSVPFRTLSGWTDDDVSAAFSTFLKGCASRHGAPEAGPVSAPWARAGLERACRHAEALGTDALTPRLARLFFEANFRAYRIVRAGGAEGFLTGYYEPVLEGASQPSAEFPVPVYARPKDLVAPDPARTNGGAVLRDAGGTLVPYYDRAAIEDGALAGQGLELCWLKAPVDLFFMQIQGSARVHLQDGRELRLNYDGFNGHPYTPVGRLLIARGLVPREEMSMDRIRAFIEADPVAGKALMRQNRSFVFFKALPLQGDAGAMGAQGVPLTERRSIAIDRKRYGYGLPFFIEARLPLSGPAAADSFRHLMIAQDTGSAIVGPARADLFFGAGAEAGAVAGRIRHPGRFTVLVPRFEPAAEARP